MKRVSTQKVKSHPACIGDSDVLEGHRKPVHPKFKRRFRTSAATIGLAVSIGGSSLLLTRQSEHRALAAEPVGNAPTLSTVAAATLSINQVEKVDEPIAVTSDVNAILKVNNRLDQKSNRLSSLAELKSEESSVQNLQTEIQRLREKYPVQQTPPQVTSVVTTSGTVAVPIVAPAPNNAAIASETRLAQASEPPTQQQASTSGGLSAPAMPQPMATAPMDLDLSEPLQLPKGRSVSPELPPLASVDIYLPRPLPALPPFSGYIWPTKGVLTSGFGMRWGRMHKGIDIAAPVGTPVFAAAPGVVVMAGWNSGGYGNVVDIQHPDGSLTRYAHNYRVLVQVGQVVEQGQEISEMGSTGHSTGPHCHFEVHPPGHGAVNPIAYLPR